MDKITDESIPPLNKKATFVSDLKLFEIHF